MTTISKRPAEDYLTSCSVAILQPVQIPLTPSANMTSFQSFLTNARTWLWALVCPPATYTDLTVGTTEIVADDYIQSSETRIDDTTTLKRQKLDAQNMAQTKHTKDLCQTLVAVPGKDMETETAAASRRANDALWRPRGHALLRRKDSPISAPQTLSSEQPGAKEYPVRPTRRHSSHSVRPSPNTNLLDSRLSTGDLTVPIYSESFTGRPLRQTKSAKDLDLGESLEKLLLSDGDSGANLLTPSSAKEQRRAEALERRERELVALQRKAQEEKRKAELEAKKALRLVRRLPNKSIIQPLNTKWENMINEIQYRSSRNQTVTTSIGGTELTGKDFATLLGQTSWLNDEIINSYIEWVVDAANKIALDVSAAHGDLPSKIPKFIAHNSFFYENLTKKGPSSTDRLMKRKGAPGASLMEVDSIFVPICRGNHWTVGTVRPVAKTIEYFDSFGNQNRIFYKEMRSWLQHQLGKDYVADEWKEPRTACARQSNGWDCGVFVCTNAFCVAFGLETSSYVERDMLQQRRNIAAVLMNRGFVGDFVWGNLGL